MKKDFALLIIVALIFGIPVFAGLVNIFAFQFSGKPAIAFIPPTGGGAGSGFISPCIDADTKYCTNFQETMTISWGLLIVGIILGLYTQAVNWKWHKQHPFPDNKKR